MAGRAVTAGQCDRCDSKHDRDRKHDIPDGLVPVGKFTWFTLVLRVLGPAVVPRGEVVFSVAAAIQDIADVDGTRVRPGTAAMVAWTGASERAVKYAFSKLASLGLIYKAFDGHGAGRGNTGPGRAAVWELTMRAEHELALEAAGYELEWREGGRKYRHAKKRGNPECTSFNGGDGGGG